MQTVKTKSQKQLILEWLQDGLSLTRAEAYKQGFGLNLPARINDLKNDGYKISDEPARVGSREKRYYIKGLYNG